jgi:hypothetical protein
VSSDAWGYNLVNSIVVRNTAPKGASVSVLNEYQDEYSPYATVTMTNCTIADNIAADGNGGLFTLAPLTTFVMTNSILWNSGIEVPDPIISEITYSCIRNDWAGTGNIDSDPRFVSPENGDYRLQNGSPCIDNGDISVAPDRDIEDNPRPGGDGKVDMGAYESPDPYLPASIDIDRPIYVRWDASPGGDGGSWESAFSTILDAERVASKDGRIWVKEGIYPVIPPITKTVRLFGGFSGVETDFGERDWGQHVTILDGSGGSSPTVVLGRQSEIDGFSISGGNGRSGYGILCERSSGVTVRNCFIHNSGGSGVRSLERSDTNISDCDIRQNYAGISNLDYSELTLSNTSIVGNRGGVYTGDMSSCCVRGCTIASNGGFGFGSGESAKLSFTNCQITGNLTAGAHFDYYSVVVFENSRIADNGIGNPYHDYGSGLIFRAWCEASISNCVICGNYAYEDGGAITTASGSKCSLRNCLLTDNVGDETISAGDYYFGDAAVALDNCNLVGNVFESYEGCLSGVHASFRLDNCILQNEGSEISTSVTAVAKYSDIEGGWPGEGNIDAPPLFVNETDFNFHLDASSPCIDAGSPSAEFNDACLPPGEGTVRNDMGAYGGPGNCGWLPPELQPTPTPIPSSTPTETPIPTPTMNPRSDIDQSGTVDAHDLMRLLEDWGKASER